MPKTALIETNSAMFTIMADLETFDGACDPAFDNDLEDMERHFAELRLTVANDLN
ncbi:MAG TPA: hypothetical protein VNX28_10025 [Gemmataceae bacterium]|jgi:hypothetical protein|nr:hypothetical protein [Gemmataceae bacterium]